MHIRLSCMVIKFSWSKGQVLWIQIQVHQAQLCTGLVLVRTYRTGAGKKKLLHGQRRKSVPDWYELVLVQRGDDPETLGFKF